MPESTSNLRVRTNIVAWSRFLERPPSEIAERLAWDELHQYLELFWLNQKPVFLAGLTADQKADRRRLRLPNPYEAVCWSHRYLLPPPEAAVRGDHSEPEDRMVGEALPPSLPVTVAVPQSEQDRVILAPRDAKQLVMAPPGTGKTHTVVARLAHLAGPQHFQGDLTSVLVVSFSRAAAAELGQRLDLELQRRGTPIQQSPRIATLDAFVGQVLAKLDIPSAGNYDASIARLLGILDGRVGVGPSNEAGDFIRSRISLVIVDEVQDLVGTRARLLTAILKVLQRNQPGLLLLGDLRQSIHEFQLRRDHVPESDRDYTSFEFIRDVQRSYSDLKLLEFTQQWRFQPACRELMQNLRLAMDAPDALPGEKPDGERMAAVLRGIPTLHDPRELHSALAEGTVAVLAWGNDAVRQLEVACSEAYPDKVRVMARGDGNGCPGWVGRLFGDPAGTVAYNRDSFQQEYLERVANDTVQAEERLEWLIRATGVDRDRFRREDVVNAIRQRPDVPGDLREKPQAGELWISTIHQAKGREFDTVVVAEVESMTKDAEACRHTYVAVTRAKSAVWRCRGTAWLPSVFTTKADVFEDPRDLDDSWRRGQDDLWSTWQSRQACRITSPTIGYELESPLTQRMLRRFTMAWGREFEVWARRRFGLTTPADYDYTVRMIDLRTFPGPDASLTLVPILSGRIERK